MSRKYLDPKSAKLDPPTILDDGRIRIRHLEMHVAHSCNLSCQFCSHYSNISTEGLVPYDDAVLWIRTWGKRVNPTHRFTLIGGEPCLHPKLTQIIIEAAKFWPRLMLVTNGLLLHRHKNLPELLEKHNVKLKISEHWKGKKYAEVKKLVDRWKKKYSFEVKYKPVVNYWHKRYSIDENRKMVPAKSSDPIASHKACTCVRGLTILNNKLYKCPILAHIHLPSVQKHLNNEWDKYLQYNPALPNFNNKQLISWLYKNNDVVPECVMCPSKHKSIQKRMGKLGESAPLPND